MIIQQPSPSPYDLKFKLLRVPVRVHPGFWIVCLFFNLAGGFNPIYFLLGTLLLFASILAHEYGHALSSRFFGERRNSVILYAMGGLCVHQDFRARHSQVIWTLLWGPFAGFVFGLPFLAGYLVLRLGHLSFHPLLYFVLINGIFINFGWGLVNLFPVFPLDGGQILREITRWKFPRRGDAFVCTVSIWTGAILAALGLAAHLFAPHIGFDIGLFAPILFGVLAFQNYMLRKQILAMGSDYGQEEEAPREPWEQDPDWWKKG